MQPFTRQIQFLDGHAHCSAFPIDRHSGPSAASTQVLGDGSSGVVCTRLSGYTSCAVHADHNCTTPIGLRELYVHQYTVTIWLVVLALFSSPDEVVVFYEIPPLSRHGYRR